MPEAGLDHVFVNGVPTAAYQSRWYYIASFDTFSQAEPTPREWAMMRSYIEYVCLSGTWFKLFYGKRVLEEKNCVDPGYNTVVFHKRDEDDWGYRRITFTLGPDFQPNHRCDYGPKLNLEELLDFIAGKYGAVGEGWTGFELRPEWAKWKADHPEAFGAAAA